ncbi:hypothetical protein AAFF_G00429070 [Aldrovandia affinis]|uniref:Uncharacterized protein n=1 Tax=Aldrovandia affinis TaxID=143900 RepID=A0AAD7WIM8_9TELE|nr:hypothetical protein AAFF_G00429070 [Aldrovandia affinis]
MPLSCAQTTGRPQVCSGSSVWRALFSDDSCVPTMALLENIHTHSSAGPHVTPARHTAERAGHGSGREFAVAGLFEFPSRREFHSERFSLRYASALCDIWQGLSEKINI